MSSVQHTHMVAPGSAYIVWCVVWEKGRRGCVCVGGGDLSWLRYLRLT